MSVQEFIRVKTVEVNGKKLLGIEVMLPDAPPLILLRGDRGFIMCGYLDISVAEKLGLVAAKVKGIKTIEDLLNKNIDECTSKAKELGIHSGVAVKDVVHLI
ncbi:MAG: DUF1805 domain-containing protein [Thermoprotei archaeon]